MFATSVVVSSLFLFAAAPAEQPKAEVEMHRVEKEIIQRTNEERRRFGLLPLRLDVGLLGSARRHTTWMCHRRVLQHTSAPVAENIAMGQRTSDEVVRDWMNSPGHRANILNAGYTRIGVSAYTAPDGTAYWCQQFLR
ncbi:MAG: CAP domain-containing protein [Pirellulales bacterium]|jgi:uncharacterized protein YkwD